VRCGNDVGESLFELLDRIVPVLMVAVFDFALERKDDSLRVAAAFL
jgi:hypothetical protein